MRTRPGRLYRRLAGWPMPLLNVVSPSLGTLTDAEVSSVTIRRGSGSVQHEPATVEVALTDYAPVISDETLTVKLTSGAAYRIFQLTGAGTGTTPARFSGRVGRQTVEDTGRRQVSTLFGSSWTVQAARTDEPRTMAATLSTGSVAATLLAPSYIADKINVTFNGTFDPLAETMTGSFSDLFPKVTSDIGTYVSERRNGQVIVQSWTERRARADAAPTSVLPLTRSAALSPAGWEQPNEVRGSEYRIKLTTTAGATYIAEIGNAGGGLSGTRPVRDLDWTYFVAETDGWKYAYALASQGLDLFYRVPTVRFDILELLASDSPGLRRQAGQLLSLEAGDPVTFSSDWPVPLRGVLMADGITEQITGSSWEIELSLTPYRWAFGDWSPQVPARMWGSARNTWASEPRTWGAA